MLQQHEIKILNYYWICQLASIEIELEFEFGKSMSHDSTVYWLIPNNYAPDVAKAFAVLLGVSCCWERVDSCGPSGHNRTGAKIWESTSRKIVWTRNAAAAVCLRIVIMGPHGSGGTENNYSDTQSRREGIFFKEATKTKEGELFSFWCWTQRSGVRRKNLTYIF